MIHFYLQIINPKNSSEIFEKIVDFSQVDTSLTQMSVIILYPLKLCLSFFKLSNSKL